MSLDLLSRLQAALGDRYTVERVLGQGGMATVYLARDTKHDREVAIKVLRPEVSAMLGRERFLNEVRLTARLHHPHILTLIDSGETDGLLWYVVPFIRGESLRQRLVRERHLRITDAIAISKQIAGALDYAHGRGVIHRDIKPENILLHEGEALLADFGIALAVKEAGGTRLTETGMSLGTPSYMSPEQATGERSLDLRSDVYALGAVLYEMLAAEPPHTGATAQAVVAKLMTERPTPLRILRDAVPPEVEAAVSKALAKIPADRFASAGEFADALTTAPVVPKGRRRWPRSATIGLTGVALLALASLAVFRSRGSVPGTPVKLTDSGDLTAAALSSDGTRLAKSVRECTSEGRCSFALAWQDLGGAGELRVVDRLGSVRTIEWSPDARQLVFQGSDSAGRYGAFRVAALGGALQYLGCCNAAFLTTSDTLLMTTLEPSRRWVLRVVTPADGVVLDSLVLGGREGGRVRPAPNGKLIVNLVSVGDGTRLVSLDRGWRPLDSIAIRRRYEGVPVWDPDGDAVYLQNATEPGTPARLDRVPVSSRGTFGRPTPVAGLGVLRFRSFALVGPSRTLLYVEGGEETAIEALTRDSPASVDFRSRLLRRSTGDLGGILSRDGRHVTVFSKPVGASRTQLAILPFESGSATPVPVGGGEVVDVGWAWNSSRLFYTTADSAGKVTLYAFDLESGRARTVGRGPPRAGWDVIRDDMLAYVDDSAGAVVLVDTNGVERRRFADPDRTEGGGHVEAFSDGRSLISTRWNAAVDTVLFTKIDMGTGRRQRIGALPAEELGWVFLESDGALQVAVLETRGTLSLYRVRQAARPVRLATYPAEGSVYYTFARDGRRAIKVELRPRGDAWMIRNFDGRARRD